MFWKVAGTDVGSPAGAAIVTSTGLSSVAAAVTIEVGALAPCSPGTYAGQELAGFGLGQAPFFCPLPFGQPFFLPLPGGSLLPGGSVGVEGAGAAPDEMT